MTPAAERRPVVRRALIAGLVGAAALLVWMLGGEVDERPLPPATPGVDVVDHPVEPLPDESESANRSVSQQPVGTEVTTLQAPTLARIAGLVVRAADGSPLDHVRVIPVLTGHDDDAGEWYAAETLGGRFELEPDVVAQGVRSLNCTWTETLSMGIGRRLTQTVVLTDVDTPLDELRITFDTGWVVRGRVLDGAGQPVATAKLGTDHDATHVWCDADGLFVLRDLAWDDSDVVVSASARGYTSARSLVLAPERPACVQSVELTLIREP